MPVHACMSVHESKHSKRCCTLRLQRAIPAEAAQKLPQKPGKLPGHLQSPPHLHWSSQLLQLKLWRRLAAEVQAPQGDLSATPLQAPRCPVQPARQCLHALSAARIVACRSSKPWWVLWIRVTGCCILCRVSVTEILATLSDLRAFKAVQSHRALLANGLHCRAGR